MRFHRIIDNIFRKKSHIKILRFFVLRGKDASIREISREIKVAHPNVSLGLAELEKEGILSVKKIGRSLVYSLNEENLYVKKSLIPFFFAEKNILDLLLAIILPRINFSYESIILFGSIARGDEKSKSDIDLAVIINPKEDKQAVLRELLSLSNITSRRLGNPLSPVVYYAKEFAGQYKKNMPLMREIYKEGKVLAGKSMNELIIGKYR